VLDSGNEDKTGSAVSSSSELWKSFTGKFHVCSVLPATSAVVEDHKITTYKQTAVVEVD